MFVSINSKQKIRTSVLHRNHGAQKSIQYNRCYQPIMMTVPLLLWSVVPELGCDHDFVECILAVRHIYGIIRHMQGLYNGYVISFITTGHFNVGQN